MPDAGVFCPAYGADKPADAVVLDANLEAETLVFIAENCTVPLYADPVSTAKAPRLLGALKRLRAIKPNAMEAMALTGEKDPERAALALLERGVEQVFISLGRDGMLAARARAPAAPAKSGGPWWSTPPARGMPQQPPSSGQAFME